MRKIGRWNWKMCSDALSWCMVLCVVMINVWCVIDRSHKLTGPQTAEQLLITSSVTWFV